MIGCIVNDWTEHNLEETVVLSLRRIGGLFCYVIAATLFGHFALAGYSLYSTYGLAGGIVMTLFVPLAFGTLLAFVLVRIGNRLMKSDRLQ